MSVSLSYVVTITTLVAGAARSRWPVVSTPSIPPIWRSSPSGYPSIATGAPSTSITLGSAMPRTVGRRDGVFTRNHTDDVLVDVHGQASTHGIHEHIQAMKAFVESTGGAPVQVKSHPIRFGSGDWTRVVGELEDGSRMVTLAKWRDGAIAEEYIWI